MLPTFAGKTSDVCISPGGRFPPFSNEGKPPKKASKGPRDLTLCRVFRKKTCCDATQTHPALLTIRRLASSGEASQDCLQLWEFLECSICDPRIGVQKGPPSICTSFCDKVYEACSTAYFAMDAKTQVTFFFLLPIFFQLPHTLIYYIIICADAMKLAKLLLNLSCKSTRCFGVSWAVHLVKSNRMKECYFILNVFHEITLYFQKIC